LGEVWTVLRLLKWTADYLAGKGIEGGRLDAEILLADILKFDRVGLYLNFDRPLVPDELAAFRERVRRRAAREPVQYILGRAEFWSLPFRVAPTVLIPRPDTEVLVEEAVKRLSTPCTVLDAGTGSGAIAIALACEVPQAVVTAVDICPDALVIAAENARSNGVEERIRLVKGDFAALPEGPFDMIVSNPPYIPEGEMTGLMPEVRDHEPRLALCGGEDGLDPYRVLVKESPRRLRPGGWLVVEVGIGQAKDVARMMEAGGFSGTFVRADYSGVERVVGGRLPVPSSP